MKLVHAGGGIARGSVRPRRAVAAFDSATAFLSALSRALDHRSFPYLGQSPLKVPLVYASTVLPPPVRRRAYAVASGREGVPPGRLASIDMEEVAAWIAGRYGAGPYPGIMIGSSNGALTHLAAGCALPWLPQTVLIPVRRPGADPADYRAAADFGAEHAQKLLDRNPGIQLHHMHDANQDALSASQMAYFRVKYRHLPRAYLRFLSERLQPDAPVVVVRDRSSWPVSRLGDRHVFQVGARGGMSAAEYLAAPDVPMPDDTAPEAEWGFADALMDTLRAWAGSTGHPLVEVCYDHPQDPAAAVADTMRSRLRQQGHAGGRLLVSSFIVHDPWLTLTRACVPFWTFFPVEAAAADLGDYLDRSSYDDIDVMLFSHGVRSRGLADAQAWQYLADRARRSGRLLGTDACTFPADFAVFARYARAIGSLPETNPTPVPMPVQEALAGLSQDARIRVGVASSEGEPPA
jgi:hypothetical protein